MAWDGLGMGFRLKPRPSSTTTTVLDDWNFGYSRAWSDLCEKTRGPREGFRLVGGVLLSGDCRGQLKSSPARVAKKLAVSEQSRVEVMT